MKTQPAGPRLRVSDFVGLGQAGISNKLPDEADVGGSMGLFVLPELPLRPRIDILQESWARCSFFFLSLSFFLSLFLSVSLSLSFSPFLLFPFLPSGDGT